MVLFIQRGDGEPEEALANPLHAADQLAPEVQLGAFTGRTRNEPQRSGVAQGRCDGRGTCLSLRRVSPEWANVAALRCGVLKVDAERADQMA